MLSILKRQVDKQNPTNSDQLQALIIQEWIAISRDLAQKLMPVRIAEVMKNGQLNIHSKNAGLF